MQPTIRIALGALALLASLAAPAQEIKARLGTSLADSHPQTIGARKFAELAEKKSNGRIRITVYPAGQMGSDQQMQSALRGGTQEFTVPSTATLASMVKEFGVLGLPFAFASVEQADAVLDGPFGKSLLGQAAGEGTHRPRVLGERLSQSDQQPPAGTQGRGHFGSEGAHDAEPGVHRPVQRPGR